MNIKSRRKLLWLSILLFLLIAPPVAFYATGWRVTGDFQLKRIGGIFVAAAESNASVYLNGKFVKNTNFLRSGVFIQELTPGKHSLRVEKENFWPWTKKLEVAESAVAEAKAFMLPQNIKGNILARDREFESIYSSNQNSLLLLEERKDYGYYMAFYMPDTGEFLSPAGSTSEGLLGNAEKLGRVFWRNGGADVFFDGRIISLSFDFSKKMVSARRSRITALGDDEKLVSQIIDYRNRARLEYDDKIASVEWLSKPLPYFLSTSTETFLRAKSQIRGVAFFPKKSDLAIAAFENGVFAVELDGRNNRNIQPIYKGKEPLFAILDNKIYILDQGVLALMEL